MSQRIKVGTVTITHAHAVPAAVDLTLSSACCCYKLDAVSGQACDGSEPSEAVTYELDVVAKKSTSS